MVSLPIQEVLVSLPRPPLPTRKSHTYWVKPPSIPRWALSLRLRWLRSPNQPDIYLNLLPCAV